MKLLVTENIPDQSTDQLVISPEKGDNIYDLDKFVDHNECEEITFTLPDYIPTDKLAGVINALANKLAHKGRLTIIGTDALEVTTAYKNGRIDILHFNTLVFGQRDKVWKFKQSLITLSDAVTLMKLQGLKIIQKRLSDFTYSVVGERE